MCLAFGGGQQQGFNNTMGVIGAATGIAQLGVGIMQGAQARRDAARMARHQENVQTVQNILAYKNLLRQTYFDRQQQVIRHIGDVNAQQAAMLAYQRNVYNNNEAANRVYMAEQLKLVEAKQKAAFKSVDIYTKQIGSMGKVLSSGAVGKSVGLLAMDPGRQAGRALAEQSAGVRSAAASMEVGMSSAQNLNESANNQALSRVPAPVQAPVFAPDPLFVLPNGFRPNLGLGIPSYNW
jgi:hypothetical protein